MNIKDVLVEMTSTLSIMGCDQAILKGDEFRSISENRDTAVLGQSRTPFRIQRAVGIRDVAMLAEILKQPGDIDIVPMGETYGFVLNGQEYRFIHDDLIGIPWIDYNEPKYEAIITIPKDKIKMLRDQYFALERPSTFTMRIANNKLVLGVENKNTTGEVVLIDQINGDIRRHEYLFHRFINALELGPVNVSISSKAAICLKYDKDYTTHKIILIALSK